MALRLLSARGAVRHAVPFASRRGVASKFVWKPKGPMTGTEGADYFLESTDDPPSPPTGARELFWLLYNAFQPEHLFVYDPSETHDHGVYIIEVQSPMFDQLSRHKRYRMFREVIRPHCDNPKKMVGKVTLTGSTTRSGKRNDVVFPSQMMSYEDVMLVSERGGALHRSRVHSLVAFKGKPENDPSNNPRKKLLGRRHLTFSHHLEDIENAPFKWRAPEIDEIAEEDRPKKEAIFPRRYKYKPKIGWKKRQFIKHSEGYLRYAVDENLTQDEQRGQEFMRTLLRNGTPGFGPAVLNFEDRGKRYRGDLYRLEGGGLAGDQDVPRERDQ